MINKVNWAELMDRESEQSEVLSGEELQFDLYVQINEVKQIWEILEAVRQKPAAEKAKYLADNEPFLHQLASELWGDAQEVLEGLSLEPVILGMTTEYMNTVRDIFNLLVELGVEVNDVAER